MTDPQPTRELTIAAATKKVVAIRRGIPDDFAAAKRKVLDDAAAREAKVLERVPEEVRHVVRKKADAECPAEPPGDRTAADALVNFDKTFGSIPKLLEGAADEPTPDPPVQPQGEQVPEPTPRGVTDYKPSALAQAARRGR